MSQPDTISAAEVFHPDGIAALAPLAGVRDDHPAWHDGALCAQTDPEAFFPEKGGSTREAKEICHRCPVRAECLADALVIWSCVAWSPCDQHERVVDMSLTGIEGMAGASAGVPPSPVNPMVPAVTGHGIARPVSSASVRAGCATLRR